MKIAYYIHSLVIGGAETLVVKYLKILQRNHNVILLVNNRVNSFLEDELQNYGIKIIPIFPIKSQNILGKTINYIVTKTRFPSYKIDRILNSEHIDILHIHTGASYLANVKFPASRIIYTFHSELYRYIKLLGEKNKLTLQTLSRQGMHFIAISRRMETEIRSYFGTQNVVYIPNGVEFDRINRPINKASILLEIGADDDTFIVGHVGRFNAVKNHERLIDIFEKVHDRISNSKLLLIGGDDSCRMQLIKEIVLKKGLKNSVYFAGVKSNAIEWMQIIDTMVIPSFSESFSLVAIEAQSLGIRCVASDNLPAEVFCNENCIRLSLNETDEAWCEAIIGSEVYTWENSLKQFDINIVMKETEDLYARVMK